MPRQFKRLPGTSRNYYDVETGEVFSRRQRDKIVDLERGRKRVSSLNEITEIEDYLARLQKELVEDVSDIGAKPLQARLAQVRRQKYRIARTSAGQRRYNALIHSYMSNAELAGRPLTYRQAQKDPEFIRINKLMAGRPNPKHNPNIRDRNREDRIAAADLIGGWDDFREAYDELYPDL